jgi:mannosylglycerate hydrolase
MARGVRVEILVVSHTHWDREWYQPLGRMRQRLVLLVDELLNELARNPNLAPFLLDGQSIVIEDYLALRPERAPELRAALAAGRLEAGPWYVLADLLIPSGEALIRNLFEGREALQLLSGDGEAPAPGVLYCPDAFGHPAALPDIALGFGLDVVVLWRGHGGRHDPPFDTVRWCGRAGGSVLLYHLPPSGYEFGANLPVEKDAARKRWEQLISVLAPRASSNTVLLLNGADHHALQSDIELATSLLAEIARPIVVRRTGLGEFATHLRASAEGRQLHHVAGERRDSYRYAWTLQGTFGSRTPQKRRNARVERLLTGEAEPWTALAMLNGALSNPAASLALIRGAWRTLLECHPHDTLCGCSVDAVADAMDARLTSSSIQARGVRHDAIAALLGADADSARGARESWLPSLVIRNAVPRARQGVAEVEVLNTIADEPVGPGSANGVKHARQLARAFDEHPPCLDGLPVQVLRTSVRRERIEPRRHYPDNDLVATWRGVMWVGRPVAGCGLRPMPLTAADDAPSALPDGVRPAECSRDPDGTLRLSNGLVQVTVDTTGRVRTEAAGRAVEDLIGVEWVADRGDLYTHQAAGAVKREWSYKGGSVRHAGPLRAELVLRYELKVPRRLRSPRRVVLPLRVRLQLNADSPLLHVLVRGRNTARDHRTRIRFHTGAVGGEVRADAALVPVLRRRDVPDDTPVGPERPVATAPLHRYVSLVGEQPATLVSDGLAEYEVRASGEVMVTLVRAVGALSRGTLPNRPGHAGWPAATPAAQCQGPFAARFALLFHRARATAVEVAIEAERAAEDALLPLVGGTWRWLSSIPPEIRGFELEGDGLVARAMLPRADGIHLRCVNLTSEPANGVWLLPQGSQVEEAWLTRLDGTRLSRLTIEKGAVRFEAPPHGAVTVLLELAKQGGGSSGEVVSHGPAQ